MQFIRNLTIRKPPDGGSCFRTTYEHAFAARAVDLGQALPYHLPDLISQRNGSMTGQKESLRKAELNLISALWMNCRSFHQPDCRSGESEVVDVLHRQNVRLDSFERQADGFSGKALPKRWISERSAFLADFQYFQRQHGQHRCVVV